MMTMKNLTPFLLIVMMLFSSVMAQNIESLEIERLYDQNIVIPAQCSPDDIVILINSSIEGLVFESNQLPDTAFLVIHNDENNQYIICHERIRFKLTVSGPNLQAEDIDVFDISENQVYRLTSNIHRGTILLKTDPPNATVVFSSLGNMEVSSESPITNNTGRYPIKIFKEHYSSIDTVIRITRDTTAYNFTLTPEFAMLKLDIATEDNAEFARAPVLWIDDRRIAMDAFMRPNLARRFYDGVREFQLHEDNIIPLPQGNYNIKVEADNYLRYETSLFAQKGRVTDLQIMMELIYGYITFLDSTNATGAKVFVNEQMVGELPIHKAKARVGENTVRFSKQGYMTEKGSYTVPVFENTNTDMWVTMRVSRTISIFSEPSASEILMNNQRIGFTPFTTEIPSGNHRLMVRKVGYSPQTYDLIESFDAKPEDTIFLNLYKNQPLALRSESLNHYVWLHGLDSLAHIEISNPFTINQNIQLPYGRYKIKATDRAKKTTYKGLLRHEPQRKISKIPGYSKSSFITLTADYTDEKNIEASFGRIHIFPGTGLSTSIINAEYRVFEAWIAAVDEGGDGKNGSNVGGEGENGTEYVLTEFETIMAYPFFMNWDWRIGGGMLRQIDICLLGRAKFTPGIKAINNSNVLDYHDAEMFSYFYGLEISSRLPVINFNVKFGQHVQDGKINVWDKEEGKYSENELPVNIVQESFMVSFGVTIGGGIRNSNNMLRLWRKPMLHQILDKYN
jgi:hypothetical protein